jgi:hypothetical protein
MPRLVVGLNLGKEEKASSVLVACSFVSGSKSCGRSGPSGRSGSNNCCVGSQRSCRRQRSNRCGSGGSNSWCCGSNNSNSKQSNHSKGNSNINSFLSRAVSGSSSGSKNKMIVIMMILAAVVVLVEY